MSLPPYSAYRESGALWPGQVPAHWAVLPLKRLVSLQSGTSILSELINESGDYPVFGGNGSRGYTASHTHVGDFALIGRQGALCGNINYASGAFWATEHAVVVTPKRPLALRWLGELLRAMNLGQHSMAAAQPGLSVDFLNTLRVPVPSDAEQTSIAAFFDRETDKIDGLVAEQERLLALLEEKRVATIAHIVTKGLDPSAPLKDSGIEWLGRVPAHWKIVRLKRVGTIQGGAGFPDEYQHDPNELLPFFKVANLGQSGDGRTIGSSVHSVSEETASKLRAVVIPARSIVYAKIGAALLLNRRRLVELDCCIDNNMTALTVNEQKAMRDWVFLWMQVLDFRRLANPGPVPSFSEGAQRELPIALPPTEEQEVIVRAITAERTATDTLAAEARASIALLRERRAALISAAVTGRINVCGAAAKSRDVEMAA